MMTDSRKIHLFIASMVVVTLLTWTLGLLDIKYSLDSRFSFKDGFPGDTTLWHPAGDWANVDISDEAVSILRNTEGRSYAKRRFILPDITDPASKKLRIHGTLETLDRGADNGDERGAAYMVWLEDDDGEVLKYLTIQELTGSQDAYEAERVISLPDSVKAFTLVLNSRDSADSFSLTDASAELISTTLLYRISSYFLVICWIAIFLASGKWLYQNASRGLFVTGSLLVAGIVIGVMLPENMTIGIVNPVFDAIASRIPSFDLDAAQSTYKVGHFVFFFFIALVLALNVRSLPLKPSLLVVLLLLLAVASEGMQLHLFNRTTRLSDLGIDTAGIMLGWLTAFLIGLVRKT